MDIWAVAQYHGNKGVSPITVLSATSAALSTDYHSGRAECGLGMTGATIPEGSGEPPQHSQLGTEEVSNSDWVFVINRLSRRRLPRILSSGREVEVQQSPDIAAAPQVFQYLVLHRRDNIGGKGL